MTNMTKVTENLLQFTERMSKVEKKEEFYIGRACYGNSRAIFHFEGQVCFLESRGYASCGSEMRHVPDIAKVVFMISREPHDFWDTAYASYGKTRAKKIAKYYKANDISELPYAEEENKWFSYHFYNFGNLMHFVYDRDTGKFLELWGEEPCKYINCFGDKTPQYMDPRRDF